jgi:thioesterase domain-containing protein
LQARGVDGITEPHETIEAMAGAYLAEIRCVQEAGPYLLGGYSGGGLVAFEMAHQLLDLNEEVAVLIMLDTATPDIRVDAPQSVLERGGRRLRGILHDGQRYAATWARERAQFERWRMREMRLALPRSAARPLPTSLREVHLTRAFHTAAERYVPKPLRVPVVLFTAPDRPPGLEHVGRDLGWQRLAIAGLDIRLASGTHDDIVREPHVAPLAEALTDVLRASIEIPTPASSSALSTS